MSAVADKPTKTTTRVLGRYTTPKGARTLYGRHDPNAEQTSTWGQLQFGATRITDEPASRNGTIYLVEICPDSDGPDAIEALIADYLASARASVSIPMAHTILDADLPVAA